MNAPCHNNTESDDEHSDAMWCIILLAILASLTVVLLVALCMISVHYIMFRKRRYYLGKLFQALNTQLIMT